jgi:hypothetical protein
MSRHGRDPQHDQCDDTQQVGIAEAAMLKDSEAGHAGHDGRDHVDLPEEILGRDLLVADERDESRDQSNHADRRVKHAERCQPEHAGLLPALMIGASSAPRIIARCH